MAILPSNRNTRGSNSPPNKRADLYIAQPLYGADGQPKIRRVLISNRGEIACRIIATCRRLDLVSIAIYVDE